MWLSALALLRPIAMLEKTLHIAFAYIALDFSLTFYFLYNKLLVISDIHKRIISLYTLSNTLKS